jgi:hypothetical protein
MMPCKFFRAVIDSADTISAGALTARKFSYFLLFRRNMQNDFNPFDSYLQFMGFKKIDDQKSFDTASVIKVCVIWHAYEFDCRWSFNNQSAAIAGMSFFFLLLWCVSFYYKSEFHCAEFCWLKTSNFPDIITLRHVHCTVLCIVHCVL